MTDTVSTAAAPALVRADVGAGAVVMWLDGWFGPVSPFAAWCECVRLHDSPIPASRERAAAIRASLNEIGYLS